MHLLLHEQLLLLLLQHILPLQHHLLLLLLLQTKGHLPLQLPCRPPWGAAEGLSRGMCLLHEPLQPPDNVRSEHVGSGLFSASQWWSTTMTHLQ